MTARVARNQPVRRAAPPDRPRGRWATADDFRAYFRRDPPAHWNAALIEASGEIIAFGTMSTGIMHLTYRNLTYRIN
jgi:hypothetical protein